MPVVDGVSVFKFRPKFWEGFRSLKHRARRVAVVLRRLRPPLQRDLKEHAKSEDSPDGQWPRRNDAADKRARRRKSRVKRGKTRRASKTRGARSGVRFIGGGNLLGQLPDTVVVRARGGELLARSPVPWSGAHNLGATVGRGSVLPARPFVFISPAIHDRAVREFADHMVAGWSD